MDQKQPVVLAEIANQPCSREISQLVVHCSATKPSLDVDAAMIDRWHRTKGWRCIGYHYVIKRDGTIQRGRPLNEVGAHVANHNLNSVGICLAGGVNTNNKAENNFTKEQFGALADLLDVLKRRFPEAEILGHRDFPGVKKDCPSFDVRKWLKSMKSSE